MEKNMKALVFDQYGTTENLHYKDIPIPTPKDNEVLIKVHSVSINAVDFILFSGINFLFRLKTGIFKPHINIPGHDLSGTVAKVGPKVTGFKVGDSVFGAVPILNKGSFAEYALAPSDHIIKKPENMSFNDAAAFPIAALTCIQAIKYNIKPNFKNKVLIYGASGGAGSFAVQVARALECDVTAVCSTRNVEAAKNLGADRVIDYKKESVFDKSEKYDLILGVNGDNSIYSYRKLLNKNGVYLAIGGSPKQLLQAVILGNFIFSHKMAFLEVKPNRKNLEYLCDLYNDEKLVSVIDKVYPKDEIVDAIKYFEKGQSRGKVVIDFTK
ncbi:hypothetical protein BB558_007345 [Smittium angustum]|uniref:Enoyl reductase (ER) domain-containing protein n=1 Tax=Smittium angustum TaxID=133377 RepID=A0A2U1IV98_SMIAN|nr:hypothetical protein BB558_007345 [Smittium angustum]